MTDRKRSGSGNAARILATGASIAAGLGLIGAFDAAGTEAAASVPSQSEPMQVIRRVVVLPTAQPDVVLQMAGSSAPQVVQQAPAPIVRTRPRAQATTVVQGSPPPAQTTSSGS